MSHFCLKHQKSCVTNSGAGHSITIVKEPILPNCRLEAGDGGVMNLLKLAEAIRLLGYFKSITRPLPERPAFFNVQSGSLQRTRSNTSHHSRCITTGRIILSRIYSQSRIRDPDIFLDTRNYSVPSPFQLNLSIVQAYPKDRRGSCIPVIFSCFFSACSW